MLLIKSIIYTSILKMQRSLELRVYGLLVQTYGALPEYIKSTTSLFEFKKFIKTWPGPKCKRSVCK